MKTKTSPLSVAALVLMSALTLVASPVTADHPCVAPGAMEPDDTTVADVVRARLSTYWTHTATADVTYSLRVDDDSLNVYFKVYRVGALDCSDPNGSEARAFCSGDVMTTCNLPADTYTIQVGNLDFYDHDIWISADADDLIPPMEGGGPCWAPAGMNSVSGVAQGVVFDGWSQYWRVWVEFPETTGSPAITLTSTDPLGSLFLLTYPESSFDCDAHDGLATCNAQALAAAVCQVWNGAWIVEVRNVGSLNHAYVLAVYDHA